MLATPAKSVHRVSRSVGRLCATLVLIAACVSHADGQSVWRAVDLGGERSGLSAALDINNAGHVVGWRAGGVVERAFLWTPDAGMVDLGGLDGQGRLSHAIAINDAGAVVGDSLTVGGSVHAFLWTASTGMLDLGTLGGDFSAAHDINASGHVVGTSTLPSGETRAFLWTPERGMVDLGTLGGPASRAYGINDAGDIVGDSYVSPFSMDEIHAFHWRDGGMRDLGTLGPAFGYSTASSVNNAAHVVGNSSDVAWWWSARTGIIPLGTPIGTVVEDMNDSDQAVGTTRGGRAFAFSDFGGMNDLGTLGGRYSEAHGINRTGQIVGSAETSSGERHAVLWCQPSVPIVTAASATPNVLSPASGDLVRVRVDYNASSPCGAPLDATLSVTSSEPDHGEPDTVVLDDRTVLLRAERLSVGAGRTYTIRIRAVDGGHEATTEVTVTVPLEPFSGTGPMTGVTLATSPASGQPAGTPIQLTAAGQGGSGPYAFRFWIYSSNAGWVLTQDWSSAASQTWLPTVPGDYTIAVQAKGGMAADVEVQAFTSFRIDEPLSPTGNLPVNTVTLATDVVSPQPIGSPVTLLASASGGTPPYLYRFWAQSWSEGEWRILQEWSSASTFRWTAAQPGGYNLAVEARRTSAVSTEAQSAIGFVVVP